MDANLILFVFFTFLLAWEFNAPKQVDVDFEKRWPTNYLLSFIALFLGYTFSTLLTDTFNSLAVPSIELFYNTSAVIEFLLIFLLLDLLLYLIHRISHYFSLLWRFHCIHHSDVRFDVSTNFRHHPIEYLWVLLVVTIFIKLLTIDAEALAVYSLVATLVQMWHHSNITLPRSIEKALEYVIITPSIHVIHHSIKYKESNMNFGSVFVFWDKVFGTYQAPCNIGRLVSVGVVGFQSESKQTLKALLLQPFHKN